MTTTEILKARLENRPGVVGASIVLRSGTYFDFLNPTPEMINIDDIGWALAHTCRFGGQCNAFYSVAQHSVIVAGMVPLEDAFAALMHDAAEAYTGDLVSPLKQLCPDFKEVEKRVEAVVAERFGFPFPLPDSVKKADLRALRTEQRDLTSAAQHDWNGLDVYEPLKDIILPMPPRLAYASFMAAYARLSPAGTM